MKINLRKSLLIFAFGIVISHFSFAQNFTKNWLFGDFGLEFQDDTVIIRKDYAPHENRGEGIISDKNGALLFYTDGINIWNKKHGLMPNGKDLYLPVGSPLVQESIVVPKPGSESLYYVFTADQYNGQEASGLYYSIVDLSLDNGLGDVTVKGQKILNKLSNHITAVYHKNLKDVWLITRLYNSTDCYSFLISEAGISASPVISRFGVETYISFDGQMKASPDGKKIAWSYGDHSGFDFHLLDFNNQTGELSNQMNFNLPISSRGADGLEFSPDATKLFVIQTGSSGESGLFQYDLSSGELGKINASRVRIFSERYNSFKQLQLAPNGKIYITKGGGGGGTEHLGVVENTNEYGANCIVKENGLFLQGGSSFIARTPNFIQNYFFKTSFTFDNTCQAHPVNFSITNDYRLDSVRWTFGEGSSSISRSPKFQYTQPGIYTVRLLAFYPGKTDTIFKQITINPFPKLDLGKDTTVCFGHELTAAEGYTSYLWNTGDTTRYIRIVKEGNYRLTVENSFGCFSSDSIFIKVVALPVISMPDSLVIGEPASIQLNPGAFNSYLWNTGETTATIAASNDGWYSVAVKDVYGCLSAKSVYVSKVPVIKPEVKTGWKLLNPLPSAHINLDITFINDQIGFIVNDKELLNTTDGGNTWKVKMDITSGKRIAFKNMIGYIIGSNGSVYKSTHFGDGWYKLNTGFTDNLNSLSLIHQDTILITSNSKLFVSNNGGQSWVTRNVNVSNIEDSYFTSAKIGHAGCTNGTILKTVDGGLNWYVTSSVNFFPSNVFRIYFIDKNIGFASRGHNDILKTIDGGETWTMNTDTSDKIYSYFFLDKQNGYIAGEYGVIFKTTNGGSTWVWAGFQNGRYDATTINRLCFIDKMRGFAVGMSGRIMKTIDGGKSWKDYSPTYNNITQLDFITDKIGYGLVGNSFLKTIDSGNNWTTIGSRWKTGNVTKFDFINGNTGYCIGGGVSGTSYEVSGVHKTIDGGKTWVATNKGVAILNGNLYSIDFVDENTGYVSSSGTIFKTVDGGNTWQSIYANGFGQIQFINASVGYARNVGYSYNRIYKTIDGGKTWVVTFDIDEDILSFHFPDENNGYFVGDNSLMYKTTDGGKSWQKLTVPYEYYVNVKFSTKNVGYISDEHGKLYKTINGGASWESVNQPYNVPGVEIFNDNIFIYGGSGVILTNKIDFQPVSVHANPATNIVSRSVTLNGNVASNGGKIENIRFEYGVSLLNNVVPVVPDTVSINASVNITAALTNLNPNTTYNYRLKATSNGIEYSSTILQFKTLPDFQIDINYVYNFFSNEADLSGNIISNKSDITNIEFQYGTDMLFKHSVGSVPGIVTAGKTSAITAKINSLKPETKYFMRIKAIHEGVEIYSSTEWFITKPEFVMGMTEPWLYDNSASMYCFISANKDTIKNIVLEYGTDHQYTKSMKITPDQVNKYSVQSFSYVQLSDLDPNAIYFYRIKATMGSKIIYSKEYILRLSGGVIIVPLEVLPVSEGSIKLQALIHSDGPLLGNIGFEYGLTDQFGDDIASAPKFMSNREALTATAILADLKTGTEYYFRLKATDGHDMYYSEVFTYTTAPKSKDFPDVIVSPNPTSQYLNIKSPYPVKKIEFRDLNGRILWEKTNEILVDISNYPPGLYFVRIFIDKGIVIRRIVKK